MRSASSTRLPVILADSFLQSEVVATIATALSAADVFHFTSIEPCWQCAASLAGDFVSQVVSGARFMLTRRDFVTTSGVALGAAMLGAGRAAAQAPAGTGKDRLVLLGTKGGPAIRGYTPSPSANLLVYKGVPYIIDAGYGVTFKLVEAGVPLPAIRHVLITHHHSDHNLELGPLLYNAWAIGLKTPVDTYGPAGMKGLVSSYWDSNRFDIELRMADEDRPDLRKLVQVHEFTEGPVFSNPDVKVMALRNKHPPIAESYSLKFELSDGRKIVFSGDTTYFPPLANFAKGADYLVHEVMYGPAIEALAQRNPNAGKLLEHLKASHTLAADVGRIATAAGVKNLVLSHFVPADDKSLTPQVWTDAVKTTFTGNVVVGRDLLEMPL
jgi:ribonuclease BN (tRNA processing enzyme)